MAALSIHGCGAVQMGGRRTPWGESVQLNGAEAALRRDAERGEILDLRSPAGHRLDDLANHLHWSSDRIVRGEFLTELCLADHLTRRGVRALGLRVTGQLDLNYATVPHPLLLNA